MMIAFHIIMIALILSSFTLYHLAVRKFHLTDEVTPAEDTTISLYRNIA